MVYRAPAPFTPPLSGTVEQRLASFANALNKKADQTLQPTYSAVQLIAADGGVWLLSVDTTGTLQVAQVPR
jgi:hypothetical protein